MLYLSDDDVERIAPSASVLADAIARVLGQRARGMVDMPAKTVITPREGGATFYAMPAVVAGHYGCIKWLGSAPSNRDTGVPHISGLLLLNDTMTGRVLTVMEAGRLTGIRTAALSLLAARFLAPKDAETIGVVGCGLQARAHVEAFRAEFPIWRVVALGRSREGKRAFVDWARMQGLTAEACSDPATLLARSDVVVTTVPAASSLRPFLDARAMKPNSFASLVDLGRSWITETLGAFDPVYTDDAAQSAVLASSHAAFAAKEFAGDLGSLISNSAVATQGGRASFLFGGTAVADVAAGAVIYERARERVIGLELPEGS